MAPLRRDLAAQANGTAPEKPKTDSYADNLETDVLIVGAGFGGVYLLHKLRSLGLNCKIFEAGTELGGIWHWNCYPGARVDSQVPVYEYSIPEVWKDWTWTEKYPDFTELRKYFEHVEKVLEIKKDVAFNTRVVSADFDGDSSKWVIETEDGRTARSRFLIVATGFAAKRHFPDWKGLDSFKGEIHHSSFWPSAGVDVAGKRVAVVGTGATGVQLSQEIAKTAASVTVFQRTPNLALPMQQGPLSAEQQAADKKKYPEIFDYRMTTFAGFQFDFAKKGTFDDDPEAREAFYEALWREGGFRFWLATYDDMLYEAPANAEAYKFWVKKTRSRISDPRKRDILAPTTPPHSFGTKRPSLEQNYYEVLDRPENDVVDLRATPITEVTPNGIRTSDGTLREFDVIALATGFDAVTGGMKHLGLRSTGGEDLASKWARATASYLGMTLAGFPNLFFLYGAHGPTAFSNGPSCVEVQGDWIAGAIARMRDQRIARVEPREDAEEAWYDTVQSLSKKTLFHDTTNSWYMGGNVPGKAIEQLNFIGGIPMYRRLCWERMDNGWEGFDVVKA